MMGGFQKRLSPEQWSDPRLARISYSEGSAVCSCGWVTHHQRAKVREDAIDRHLMRRHAGRGIRL